MIRLYHMHALKILLAETSMAGLSDASQNYQVKKLFQHVSSEGDFPLLILLKCDYVKLLSQFTWHICPSVKENPNPFPV